MRCLALLLCVIAGSAAAQQPAPPLLPESARAESIPLYTVPTPAQALFMNGLRTVGRGINQLKDAVNRVTMAGRDSLRRRRADHLLGGLCGAARGFMIRGRGRMQATAYQDSTALRARRLAAQVDTLIRFTPKCEADALKQPDSTLARLLYDLRAYEAALRDFRAAIGLPNKAAAPQVSQ